MTDDDLTAARKLVEDAHREDSIAGLEMYHERIVALARTLLAEVAALRGEVERLRPLAVVARAAQAWRDASRDVEGQAWREQRALVAAIDALDAGGAR